MVDNLGFDAADRAAAATAAVATEVATTVATAVSTAAISALHATFDWVDDGAMVGGVSLTATITNPTLPTTTIVNVQNHRDMGNKTLHVKFNVRWISNVGAVSGSGDYLFLLPGSFSFDTAVHPIYTGVANRSAAAGFGIDGAGAGFANTSHINSAKIVPFSATQYRIWGQDPVFAGVQFISSGFFDTQDTSIGWYADFICKTA